MTIFHNTLEKFFQVDPIGKRFYYNKLSPDSKYMAYIQCYIENEKYAFIKGMAKKKETYKKHKERFKTINEHYSQSKASLFSSIN